MQFGLTNYSILFVYLGLMIAVGAWWSRRQKTTEDYFLAGRRMPWIVVSMSAFVSLTSAISYLGVPRTSYEENISMIVGYVSSPIVAVILIAVFMPFYFRLRVTTSYEYIDRRFGQTARFVIAGLWLLSRLGWLGTVIFAPSLALSVVTGMPLWATIILIGTLATIYTTLGGLSAVIWTDMVQFIILAGGAVWVAITLIQSVPDGVTGIWQIAEQGGRTSGFHWGITLSKMSASTAVIAMFLAGLHDFGTDQVTVQRLLAVPRFRDVAKAILANAAITMLIMSLLLFIGIGLFAYYKTFPGLLDPAMNQDKILPFYIMQALPVGISGLLVTAIFAAAMSSMDSGIHSLSTVVVHDFVRPLRGRSHNDHDDHSDLVLARVLVVVLGILATVVAFWVSSFEHVLDAAATILGLFNAPILALFMLGMFTRRGLFAGWIIGVFPAMIGLLTILQIEKARGEVLLHWYYRFPFSFVTCITIGYVASRCFKRPLSDHRDLTIWRSRDVSPARP